MLAVRGFIYFIYNTVGLVILFKKICVIKYSPDQFKFSIENVNKLEHASSW